MTTQSEPTPLIWGCGHLSPVRVALDPVQAAEQIAAYTRIECIDCARAKRVPTRGITWFDPR